MEKTIRPLISILALWAVCAFVTQSTAAEEPKPKTLVLFGSGEDVNKAQIEPVGANTSVTSAGALRVRTEPNKEFPGVIFKPKEGTWNLLEYAEVSAQLNNVGTEPVRLYLRVDNSNADMWSNSNLQSVILKPGEKRKLSTFLMLGQWRFDKPITLIAMRGSPADKGGINPSKITQVCVLTDSAKTAQCFEIDSITAGGQFRTLNTDNFIPFIDQFGQFIHDDWPGKTHSLEELREHQRTEEKQLVENPGPDNWDKFGGYKAGPKLETTGFFRAEKYQDNWWLVDPDGYLFWSHGIDCVRMENATPITDRENYFANLPDTNSPLGKFYGTGNWGPQGYYKTRLPYRIYDFSRANLIKNMARTGSR